MTVDSSGVGVDEEGPRPLARDLARIQDRNPSLGRVHRVREVAVEDRVVAAAAVCMCVGRVAEEFLISAPSDGDVEPRHAGTVQIRGGVEPVVILSDDSARRRSTTCADRPEQDAGPVRPARARAGPV